MSSLFQELENIDLSDDAKKLICEMAYMLSMSRAICSSSSLIVKCSRCGGDVVTDKVGFGLCVECLQETSEEVCDV